MKSRYAFYLALFVAVFFTLNIASFNQNHSLFLETSMAYPVAPPTPTSSSAVTNKPFKAFLPLVPNVVPTPRGAGDALYVEENWSNTLTFNGQSRTIAYVRGYEADINIPTSYNGSSMNVIIIAFGRQAILSVDAAGNISWGVNLPEPNNGLRSNAWVKSRAQEFIQGYADGHNTAAKIVIGTSNGNGTWECNNNSTASNAISTNWELAGKSWGSLVTSITTNNEVEKWGGNDIESWNGEFGTWVACGKGTLKWYDGFRSTAPNYLHLNFGSNAYAENNAAWTRQELYQVSFGRPNAVVAPQIYCSSQVNQWVDLRKYYIIVYRGVTATNGIGTCGNNVPMYTWNNAWIALNNGLTNASVNNNLPFAGPFRNSVLPSVMSFFYN